MNLLAELKIKLDSLGTLGLLKYGSMPASPDEVGVLYEYGGQQGERGFGVVGIKYEKPSIQVVFRGKAFDYDGPRTKAGIALQFIASFPPGALGGGVNTVYLQCDPQQSPFPMEPVDANNRFRIGFNCYIMKEPS